MSVAGGRGRSQGGMDRFQLQTRDATSLLQNRFFRRLWAAQFSTVMVLYGLSLAGAVLVEERTHSSAQTGLVILSSILPAFLGSLVAGAVVDQRGRVQTLMASHLARAIVGLLFCGSIHLLPSNLALAAVYLVNAAGAAFTQFALSAEMSLLPELAGQTNLISANALLQFTMLIAEGLGIVFLGPLVIKLAGVPAMGLLSALLHLLALALVARLPRDKPTAGPPAGKKPDWATFSADIQAGWHTIHQDRLLRRVAIQATLAAALLLVLLSLVPGLVSRHLGLKVEDAPLIMLPGGLGFVVGAVLLSRCQGRLSRQVWIAVGLIGLGVNIGLIATLQGQGGNLLLVLAPILCVGLAMALVLIPARTVLQERPPAQMRGRVIAAQLALGNAAAVVPLLLGGSLADQLGIRPVMGLLSLLALGAGVAGLYHPQG